MSKQEWTVLIVVGGIVALASLVGAIILAVRVWRTRAVLTQLGAGGRFAFYGALAYLVLPIDVLPDPIYLDDMGILAGALLYLGRLVSKHRAARVPRQATPPARSPQRRD